MILFASASYSYYYYRRFAAPAGPVFLGRSVAQLIRAPAREVFGRATAIVPRLLQAVQGGNTSVAEALGDHYSENRAANSQLYEMDLQRDIGWLRGAQVASVTTSREQTLSGQWATVLRFDWRPDSSAQWRHATLRVKTERWLLITYIRAVELVEN